jgi:ABC-type multidrug transport system fused ATPase/permease subunit
MLLVLDILISIADIVFLALLLFLIHLYAGPASAKELPLSLVWLTRQRPVGLIAVFFLLYSGKNLAGFLSYKAQCEFICKVASRISEDKLAAYLAGGYSGYTDVDSAANVRGISHDPSEFAQHVLGGLLQIVTQSVLIILSIAAILCFNARLFLLLFAILLPPVFAIFYYIKRKRHAVRHSARESSERSLQHLQEALAGFVESNVYDKNKVFLNRYATHQRRFNKYISDQLIVQGIPNRMIEIFALLGVVILMVVSQGGTTSSSTIITIGVFMAAAYKIIPGIVRILSISGQMNTYSFTIQSLVGMPANNAVQLSAARLQAGKTEEVSVSDHQNGAVRSIRFRNVYFSYNGRPVLQNLNMDIVAGDFLGISGISGKGKTTILNLLLGFLTPEKGEILLNDVLADSATRRRFWQHISYVKQQPFILHDTILHNITLNGYTDDKAKLERVIEVSGLAGVLAHFPEKWDTIIAENGKNISGGQKQRLAIARALYKDADLIILDEPFNELDEESEDALLQHFRQLAQAGKTVILITHNKQSLTFCNKILSLDQMSGDEMPDEEALNRILPKGCYQLKHR